MNRPSFGFYIFFFFNLCLLEIKAQDELISVAVIFRHGDRTPLTTYPNDPYNDILFKDDDPGQLTNNGKIRQYELGKWIRKRYNDLIPTAYSHNNVSVVSDDSDRCLMSAAAQLAGLYPPAGKQIWNEDLPWQPIPIHVDTYLLRGVPSTCPVFDVLMAEIMLSQWAFDIDARNRDLYELVANATGEPIISFLQLSSIRDILYIESTLGLDLPSWTEPIYPGDLDDLAAITFGLSTNTTEMAKFSVGPLYHDIVEKFENPSKPLYLYSGHDSNVAALVFTLTPSIKKFCPSFAASVVFELWQRADEKIIKVFLKNGGDEVIPIDIEGCGEECPLTEFQNLFREIIVSPLEFQVECLGL